MAQSIQFREGWERLSVAIEKLQKNLEENFTRPLTDDDRKEISELMCVVYTMCTQRPVPLPVQLYTQYREVYREYLTRICKTHVVGKQGEALLRELEVRWKNQATMNKWMGIVFQYLDRFYTKTGGRLRLEDVALKAFKVNMFDRIHENVCRVVLDFIRKEREGEAIPRQLIKTTLRIFVECGMGENTLYVNHFERAFLRVTGEHYRAKSQQWSLEDSATEFLKKAEARINEEIERVEHYLHPDTKTALLEETCEEVLAVHQMHIINMDNSGMRVLLQDQRKEDLARMFRLYELVDDGDNPERGLEPMQAIFRDHVAAKGMEIVDAEARSTDKDSAAQYIPNLLDIHDVFLDLVTTCFNGHHKFHKALKMAFEKVVCRTVKNMHTAERIAVFCDRLLRGGGKGEHLDETAMEAGMDKIVRLVGYLHERDVFGEFYRKLLAKRLLQNRSENIDFEKSMISKLKYQYGGAFTSKLEGMVNDKSLSADTSRDWKQHVQSKQIDLHGIEFEVQVLTQGFWPSDTAEQIQLPAEMVKCVDQFQEFYLSKTPHRVLHWIHQHSTAVAIGHFNSGKKDITMTCYQLVVCLLFNNQSSWTVGEIQKASELPAGEVKRALVSLSAGKYKILTREKGEGLKAPIKEDTRYSYNADFKDRARKIKIPSVASRISSEERSNANNNVQEDRKHQVDAAIVRIMKSRKELEHHLLVNEAIQQLSSQFQPQPRMIKTRIEDLITRDYLERAPDQTSKYRYVA